MTTAVICHTKSIFWGAYWSFEKRDKSTLLSVKKWKCKIFANKWQLSVKTVKISCLNVKNEKWECHGRSPIFYSELLIGWEQKVNPLIKHKLNNATTLFQNLTEQVPPMIGVTEVDMYFVYYICALLCGFKCYAKCNKKERMFTYVKQ